jgi:dTDP-N-acetylfucosamine:lipid II N-acetylfucosaminyltransferase
MNLHIVPDNVFINKFYDNLLELGIAENNRLVVRTNSKTVRYLKHNFPFAPLYSGAFEELTGPTRAYQKVFIHQFTPLLYRWVATHELRELNWMVWGSDLYNLPAVRMELYESLTLRRYIKRKFSASDFLYRAKVAILHEAFRSGAYMKVSHILTWMKSEYDFASNHLTDLKAGHRFFFYENDMPYQALDEVMREPPPRNDKPLYILGNSSTAELNHMDAVAWMNEAGVKADLALPISYGDARYSHFLKNNLLFYRGGELRFVDQYMNFNEYLQFLYKVDGLIMNNIRPQGYGNIFMMMYLGKKVFLNEKNLSIPELTRAGLIWRAVTKMNVSDDLNWKENRTAVTKLLSHSSLLETYGQLFS